MVITIRNIMKIYKKLLGVVCQFDEICTSNLIHITLSGTSEAVAAGCKKDQTPARPI